MARSRTPNWADKKRITFTVSYGDDPEILAFLHSETTNVGKLCARLLRDHLHRSKHRCTDLAVCSAIRSEALLHAARSAPPRSASREESHPTPVPATKATSTAGASAAARTKQVDPPPVTAATPRDTAAEKPGAADSGANSAVIKAFLS